MLVLWKEIHPFCSDCGERRERWYVTDAGRAAYQAFTHWLALDVEILRAKAKGNGDV